MSESPQTRPAGVIRLRLDLQGVFLLLAGVLASTIVLKVGPVQYLELIYFGLIFALLAVFAAQGFRVACYRTLFRLGLGWVAFCLAALVLALAALRFDFYQPPTLYWLKSPVYVTLARAIQLIASIVAMLYIAQVFGDREDRARFAMKVFFYTGVASAIYSILSLPLSYVGFEQLGAYSNLHRLRGFYNEGGPYGIYVIGVALTGIALERMGWVRPRRNRVLLALLMVTFLGCRSKAGILAVLLVIALNGLLARSGRTRLIIAGTGLAVTLLLSSIIDFSGATRAYQATAAAYERVSHLHANDPNFIYGRVAGAFIVPRMIAAHPLTGVGWGNYGLLRNAPEYRGAAVFTEDIDDPGLGLFGLAAELGLPLLALLLACMLAPFLWLRSLHAPTWLTNLAILQPLAHLCGAQLNLTYPWIVTAFALGLGFLWRQRHPLTLAKPV